MVEPRICTVPDVDESRADEAIELAEKAGLILDPWQQFVLRHALGVRENGQWSAFEVGLVVPRQNGKGAILEARELAGLFIFGERLLIHSAHQFDTSLEAFRRLLWLVEDCPDLDQQVKRVSRAHGEEGIELKNGQRIRFRTRTKGGGRGFSGDCLILDEAMMLPETAHGALLPTLSARPNPQVWYTGSAVDQEINENGYVLTRVRDRGLRGDNEDLAYMEWSARVEVEGDDREIDHVDEVADDREAWAHANPGVGIRISDEHIAKERNSMDLRTFAVERLGVGDWPDLEDESASLISLEQWQALTDHESAVEDPVVFAADTRPDRSASSISVAGRRADGLFHVEIIERKPGTGWVVDYLVERTQRHDNEGVAIDQKSPAASLIPALENAGVKVHPIDTTDHARACGRFYDTVEQQQLRHLGTPELTAAIKGAARRPLGDAWAWSRKSSAADISPLVASTLALWVAANVPAREPMFSWG